MSDAPAPLVPAEVDLRGLPFMPLDVVRLLDSDLFAVSTGDEFKAAVALWCKSWLQVPAASLPNDDRVLAYLSGAGARWARLREGAMRGWVLCSDDRWYHPVVAEKALGAWQGRLAQRDRTARARQARQSQRAQPDSDSPVTMSVTDPVTEPVTTSVTDNVTASKGEGEGECKGEGKKEPPSPASQAQAPLAEPPLDLRDMPDCLAEQAKRRKRAGTLLPDDWTLGLQDREYALARRFDDAQVADMAENFRTYWTAGKGRNVTHRDWSRAWQTWVRNTTPKPSPQPHGGPHGHATRDARPDPETAAAARFLGRPHG